MKKFLVVAGLLSIVISASAQRFPNTDSLRRYININIRNSAVQAFTNLRMNTALLGMLDWIDSARAGEGGALGIDQIQVLNDSTLRYRLNGVYTNFNTKGVYDSRRKVDSLYMLNDTIMRVVINGQNRNVLIRGGGGTSGSEALDASSMVRANSKLYSKNPVFTTLAFIRALATADLNTGFIYRTNVNGVLGEWYYDAADASTVDDTAMTLVTSAGKRLKRQAGKTIYPEWWGAVGNATSGISGTNDAPAFNAMFRWLERQTRGSYEIKFLHTDYYVSSSLVLPYTLGILAGIGSPYLTINGDGVTIKTDQSINIFYRMPATDADVSVMNNNYKLVVRGLTLQGDRTTSGQVGLRIGCGYGWSFEKMFFTGLDTAAIGSFMTKSTFSDCFFNVNQKVDIKLQSLLEIVGTQTGAGSASNANTIQNCRFFEYDGAYAAVMLLGTDNTVINHYIIEGAQPRYGIFSDYQGNTVVNALYINDGWFESNSSSPSVNFRILGQGLTRITNLQRSYVDTLFDFSGSAAGSQFEIDGLTYTGNLAAKPFSVGTVDPQFSGKSILLRNIDVNTYLLLIDATKWVGGAVPLNMRLEHFQGANDGYTLSSATTLDLWPSAQFSEGTGYVRARGNLIFKTDNVDRFGGVPGNNLRPIAGYFGTTGVYIDNSGRLRWGSGTVTSDVTIARDSIGRLSILDNANTFADLKLRVGKFFGRSGYDTAYSLASLADNDFVTKQNLNDALAASSPNIEFDDNLLPGAGSVISPVTVDTTGYIATKWDVANAVGIGLTAVSHDITLLGDGTGALPLKVDTTVIATLTALYKAIDSLALATGGTPPDGSETIILDGVGYTVQGSGTTADPYTFTITGTPTSNPFKALSIESYGGIANATTPGSGSNHGGTDNTPFMNSAIAAAASGQWLVVPSGDWGFFTPIDTIKGSKVVNLLFIGNVKLNGNDLFRVVNGQKSGAGGGTYEQHKIIFQGQVDGRANQPAHSYSTYIAGTGPVWSGYTNVLVKLINVNQSYIETNKATGLKAVVEIIGSDAAGSQENTVIGRFWPSNKHGVLFTSLDGNSYNDKNKVKGPQGGTLRVGGYQPFYFDGFSGTVGGEQYNGAFRSDEIEAMLENFEEFPGGNGDITEPVFKFTVEGGATTGALNAASKWTMRSVSPNYVRSPRYAGGGYLDAGRLGSGSAGQLGVNGVIEQAIWSAGSTAFYGNRAKIDGSGNVIIQTPSSTNQTVRSAAPAYIKFINEPEARSFTTITAATYTVGTGITDVFYNNAAGTITLPSATTWPTREIAIYNRNANPLIVSNTTTGTILLGGQAAIYTSEGSSSSAWFSKNEGNAKYTLSYSQTAAVLVTNTTETTIISGGSKTVAPGSLLAGDKIIVKGRGGIQSNGSIHFKFTFGTKDVIMVPANTATIPTTAGEDDNDKDWEYEMEYTCTTPGTSGAGFLSIKLNMEGETPVMFNEEVASGLNSVVPTVNVQYKNNGGANICSSLSSTIEVIRK